MDRMIPTDLIISDALILRLITICIQFTFRKLIPQSFDTGLLSRFLLLNFFLPVLILILLLSLSALLFLLIQVFFLFCLAFILALILILHATDFILLVRLPRGVKSCMLLVLGLGLVLGGYLLSSLTHSGH